MRPIDADALIDKCGGWYVEEGTESGFIGTLKNLLATMPTIQPEKAQLSQEDTTSDLISRQQAIDAANDWYEGLICGSINGLIKRLNALPSAQPEPKEGHWIRRDCGLDVECKCSRCGYKDFVKPRDEYWFKRNYCPNCGAKMITK